MIFLFGTTYPEFTVYIEVNVYGTSKERFVPPVYLSALFNNYCLCFPYLNQVISSGIHKSASLIKSPVRYRKWSFEEERALVEFVGLAKMDPEYSIPESTQWPAFKAHHPFWKKMSMSYPGKHTVECASDK